MRVLYAQAVYGQEEIDAVVRVLTDKALALMNGPSVKEFEGRVARLFGKQHGLMVNSGSSANTLAVACLQLPPGSEVITPVLTFSTTVAPLVQQGLVPAFVDVEIDTFNIDVSKVEEMITPRTRALMVPNLLGNLPPWHELRAIADRHSLRVIEDSADTIGSRYRGAPTGALSDVATTSFYASHVVTAGGFGGAVCTNDSELARRARLLSGWGRSSTLTGESESIDARFSATVDGVQYDNKFIFEARGYNFLPSEISAAFGLVQLGRLAEYSARRVRNFNRLFAFFKGFERWFILPRQQPDVETPWLAFPLIVRPGSPFSRRDLQLHFESNHIQTRPVFTGNILRQPGFEDIPCKTIPGGYVNADRVMSGGILLGCHQGMGDTEVDYICGQFESLARRF
jgi:CDP-4-dehydro-6-deoxyglucose reductase, E1